MQVDTQYEDLLRSIIAWDSTYKSDRTGTGIYSKFGTQLRYDLSKGFPLITTKRVSFHNIVVELLWYLRGDTNIAYLHKHNVHIWDDWADDNGELGPVYGEQWRRWNAGDGNFIDQISVLMNTLKTNLDSRRMVVSAWNPGQMPKKPPAACHTLFQLNVAQGKLSCQVYQRSADMFLGVPYNLACYALLTHMIARQVGLDVGELIWTGGDTHVYSNHLLQVGKQLLRDVRPFPKLWISDARVESIFDYERNHFGLDGYDPHPAIPAPVAV